MNISLQTDFMIEIDKVPFIPILQEQNETLDAMQRKQQSKHAFDFRTSKNYKGSLLQAAISLAE